MSINKLLGKATNPEFWKQVREKDCYKKYREELFKLWDKCCEGPIYAMRYSEFSLYKKEIGDRTLYQRTYFSRRLARDASALLALIYPEEEKYINRLMDELYSMCDEYTWCLPAHHSHYKEFRPERVDLFAAETAFVLSEIYVLFGDRLEPLIRNRILKEVKERVIIPFTEVDFYGGWEFNFGNWTAVCTSSVAGAIMHLEPEKAKELIPRFNKAMDGYLSSFADDGICTEGVNYWHYGFGHFTVYADMVRSFTDGEVDYFKNEKVKTIATFMQKMYLTSGKVCVSFSDCGQIYPFHLGLLHYLKNEYPNDVLAYSPEDSYNYDGCGRFALHLRSALWLNEDYYYAPDAGNSSYEYFAKESKWFTKRTPNYGFAAKGGHNGEPHNHCDVGTFIFAKNGKQTVADIGTGTYSRHYRDTVDGRYVTLACSSRGHNLPLIDGLAQSVGKEFSAKDMAYENGVLSMEIAGAYSICGLEAVNRSFSFTDTDVTLQDSFAYTGEGEIKERLVTLIEPKVENDTVTIDDTYIKFDSNVCSASISTEMKDSTLCYLIDFTLKDGVSEFEITIS